MAEWVLAMEQADAPNGESYFRFWTAIGPCGTWDVEEAMRFTSEQSAMQSQAYSFPLTFYRPKRIG